MKTPEEYIGNFKFIKEDVTGIGQFEWIDDVEKQDLIKVIKQAQIESYNEAIDDAAENADTEYSFDDSMVIVDKESILKLKK